MSIERRTTILRILDDQNRLSERADTKAISLLSTLGIFTVFFIAHFRDIPLDTFSISILVVYFISVLAGIMQIILVISPRIRPVKHVPVSVTDPGITAPQTTFFEGICQFKDSDDYKKCLDTNMSSDESITDSYVDQIYSVARINKTKYACVKRAVWLVVVALTSQLAIIAYTFAST